MVGHGKIIYPALAVHLLGHVNGVQVTEHFVEDGPRETDAPAASSYDAFFLGQFARI